MYYEILSKWHTSNLAETIKRKRFDFFNDLAKKDLEQLGSKIALLDLGCDNGKDFLRFLFNNDRFDLYGIDIQDRKVSAQNFKFFLMDAEKIDFPDKYFDVVVSMGVLEHIQPIEKLCRAISEIDRISKSYYIVVPSVATLFEPHTGAFYWQLRDHNKKSKYLQLNYFSDDAWLQFGGFKQAKTLRKNYLGFVKQDLWIYKNCT